MNKKTALVLGAVLAALIGSIALTLYLLQSQQDVRSRAQVEPTPAASTIAQATCPTPSQVQNVLVEFPNCVGDVCNFTQASCSWSSTPEAVHYQLRITQVESGEIVRSDRIAASVTRVEFPIVQNRTYKCDVSAINSCGASGIAGSHSLLCAVDALVATPTPLPPTPTPVPSPILTPSPVPTSTPVPTIPPVGAFNTSVAIGLGTIVLILTGIALMTL